MAEAIKNRYEFVVLFDVENGNPNGDPDAGNMPRIDPETGYGLVTDVCLKRKIRNFVETAKEDEPGYRIYIKDGVPLNTSDKEACAYVGVDPTKLKDAKKKDEHLDEKLRDFMCANFYDIRTFGAVMTTFVKGTLNCGQVRGPVQIGFARSVDPILPQEITITRICLSGDGDARDRDLLRQMRKRRVRRWAASTLSPTACTVWRAMSRQTSRARRPGFLRRICLFCGRLSSTCLKTTTPLRAARWPCAS